MHQQAANLNGLSFHAGSSCTSAVANSKAGLDDLCQPWPVAGLIQ